MSGAPTTLGPETSQSQREAAALLAQIRNRVERLEEREETDPPNYYRITSESVTATDSFEVS